MPKDDSIKEKQALAFIQEGNLKEAEEIYRDLVSRESQNYIVYGNLAAICIMKGDKRQGINLLKKTIKLKPDYPEAHCNLGVTLQEQGDLNAAISYYQQAINYKPNFPKAHYNLGLALQEQGDLEAASFSYQQAIKLKLDYPEAHCNLGVTLQEQGDLNAAISYYQQAINYKPNFPKAYCNLGRALQEQGHLDAAISSYQKAIKLKPDDPEAHSNLGLAFLLDGNYQQGWLGYEYRFKISKNPVTPHVSPPIPQWQGETLNSSEKLLVVSEQGLGDTMQFMRYIPHLRQLGIDISFCAQTKLHDLIKVSGITSDPLMPEQGKDIKKLKWVHLLSVLRLLDVTPDNPITVGPYIQSSKNLTAKWNQILSKENSPIIGINWQGNPKAEISHLKGRSIPLELFSILAENHNCKFLSLQKGFGSEQLETCSFKDSFVDCQDQVNEIWEFLEIASIIANCDLVITSDTSVAHLAAGMGKPTWCLLHFVPDWRWGMHGETTFWYPSMKLFRQKQRNNWSEVMKRVSSKLNKELEEQI